MAKKLSRLINKFSKWRKEKAIDKLLKEVGIDISPEEGVFGVLSQAEEQIVLERLYSDKLFLALLRKYAEGANKKMIDDVKKQDWHEASRHNGQFFTYANLLRKTKKAHENQIKAEQKQNDANKGQS